MKPKFCLSSWEGEEAGGRVLGETKRREEEVRLCSTHLILDILLAISLSKQTGIRNRSDHIKRQIITTGS